MATHKEWQSDAMSKVYGRITDDGILINGDSFWTNVASVIAVQNFSVTTIDPDQPFEWYHETWGRTPREGLVEVTCDEQIMLASVSLFHDLRISIPAGAIVKAAQCKIMETGYAGGTTTASGLGIAGNINKYCNSQNAPDLPNINPIPTPYPNGFTPLALQEDLRITATTNAGAAGDTPWSTGRCRIRVVYEVQLDLERL